MLKFIVADWWWLSVWINIIKKKFSQKKGLQFYNHEYRSLQHPTLCLVKSAEKPKVTSNSIMATAEEQQPSSAQGDSLDATVDMIELFEKTVTEHEATFVVFYRGDWWPYCKVGTSAILVPLFVQIELDLYAYIIISLKIQYVISFTGCFLIGLFDWIQSNNPGDQLQGCGIVRCVCSTSETSGRLSAIT